MANDLNEKGRSDSSNSGDLQRAKLVVIDTAFRKMYGELWTSRWPMADLVKFWGAIVDQGTPVAVSAATVWFFQNRTERVPPSAAEFRERMAGYMPRPDFVHDPSWSAKWNRTPEEQARGEEAFARIARELGMRRVAK